MSFSDSVNFRIQDDWGDRFVLHSRDLGEKKCNIYKGKKWSDVVINGTPLDNTMDWQDHIEYLNYYREVCEGTGGVQVDVTEKKVDDSIRESSTYHETVKGPGKSNKNSSGEGSNVFFRKRKIPKARTKNYPVKPVRDSKRVMNDNIYQEYNDETNIQVYTDDFSYDPCIGGS